MSPEGLGPSPEEMGISQEELLDAQRELHESGRAQGINETTAEYQAERAASLPQPNETPTVENGALPEKGTEDYRELANVVRGQEQLTRQLADGADTKAIEGTIYEMLTSRSEYAQMLQEKNGDLSAVLGDFAAQRQYYNNQLKPWVIQQIESSGTFRWNSNPGWFGVDVRPEAPARSENNSKVYATIPIEQYNFIQHVPGLAGQLRELALATDDNIAVKFPETFAGFLAKNDSLVIHFKNPENAARIQELLSAWMSESGIIEDPREMDRTKVAADSGKTSFSALVAANIASWLTANRDSYSPELLGRLGVDHAIEQSQRPPELSARST